VAASLNKFCVVLCNVFRLTVVLFCVMCVVCVLCLIVVPLSPDETAFAVKIIFFFLIHFISNQNLQFYELIC
jgi:hypothetical protein